MKAIYWVSNITGFKGHGKNMFSQEDAQELCNTMNRKYSELNHYWVG